MKTQHFLLADSTLQDFLSHMKEFSPHYEMDSLVDAWRAAERQMASLRDSETGCADQAAVLPLPPPMTPHAQAIENSPEARLAHSRVPVFFGLVEFDGMMTVKRALLEDKLEAARTQVGANLDDSELAAICFPSAHTPRLVSSSHWDGERLLVVSDDDDVRLLQFVAVDGKASESQVDPGVTAASLQLSVGHSLPLMHAVRLKERVLLVKGHHRARVLRSRGVTFLPCIISMCESIDDVLAAAPGLDRQGVERCFQVRRPCMLRDFSRSSLVHTFEARTRRRLLQVRMEVSSSLLP